MKSEIHEHVALQTLKYKAVGYFPLPMRQQAQKKFSFKLHKKKNPLISIIPYKTHVFLGGRPIFQATNRQLFYKQMMKEM